MRSLPAVLCLLTLTLAAGCTMPQVGGNGAQSTAGGAGAAANPNYTHSDPVSMSATSPSPGKIYLTITSAGPQAPYDLGSQVVVTVAGATCSGLKTGDGQSSWNAGGTVVIDSSTAGCGATWAGGQTVHETVKILGAVVSDQDVVIR